ncbi:MAG TPA: PilW family protein [Thermoanaerobaculia bacterium]|nr:PilW family protein [Thermoanaerobaculia bacterium]
MKPRPAMRSRATAGFTVIEVVITLFVLVLVLVAVLALFDASNRMARTQIHLADLQQSLRVGHNEIVRMTRMASRGWVINRSSWQATDQVRVTNNVSNSTFVDGSSTPALKVLAGTDILRIRGVIAGSVFEPTNPSGVFLEPRLRLETTSPSGVKQDLEEIKRARDEGNAFRVLLVSRQGEVSSASANVQSLNPASGTVTDATIDYDPLTSLEKWVTDGHPIAITGIIEEYAFYIRENGGQPRLSMARFKPGTNLPYGGQAANLQQDIAADFLDLQVALAIDKYSNTNGDGVVDEKDHGDHNIAADEWFYSTPGGPAPPALGTEGDLAFVRINTLARTQGQDFQYASPALPTIEDHTPPSENDADRRHRRRFLQTVVDLRNM